jgi:hypothetical protein
MDTDEYKENLEAMELEDLLLVYDWMQTILVQKLAGILTEVQVRAGDPFYNQHKNGKWFTFLPSYINLQDSQDHISQNNEVQNRIERDIKTIHNFFAE